MSSNSTEAELHTVLKCGWCGKDGIPKALTEPGTSYLKNCQCCGNLTYNHKNCARLYVKQSTNKKDKDYNSSVSIEYFNQCRLPHYCQECNQKECFVCKKKHTQRKFLNFIFIYYITLLQQILMFTYTNSYI